MQYRCRMCGLMKEDMVYVRHGIGVCKQCEPLPVKGPAPRDIPDAVLEHLRKPRE